MIALGIPAYLIAKQRAIVNVQTQVKPAYADEWWFKKSETGRAALCVAMSGGGIRSAAFNIGVLRVLHERGLLAKTDVMSAVSGGSYVLSWYLLQQFYSQQPNGPRQSLEKTQKAIFDWNDVYQQHLANHARQFRATDSVSYYASAAWSLVYDISAFNMVRLISVLGNENLRNSSSSREGYGTWSRATPTISKSSLASWPPGDYRARPTECPS